jgi:hypothetical protein
MPIANSKVNHTPAHSQITQPANQAHTAGKQARKDGDGDGARRMERVQHCETVSSSSVPCLHTRTVLVTVGSTGHRAQWPFASKSKQAEPCVCTCARAPAPKLLHSFFFFFCFSFDFLIYIHILTIRWLTVGHVPLVREEQPKTCRGGPFSLLAVYCQETLGESDSRPATDRIACLASVDGSLIANGRCGWAVCVQMQLV